jgi:hypothetical protein
VCSGVNGPLEAYAIKIFYLICAGGQRKAPRREKYDSPM